MAKRKKYDWHVIDRAIRAGQLSNREIASQHGCAESTIRKRIKNHGITRDLSNRVAQKVRTDLVRGEVRTANPVAEKKIVEQAAATAVQVIRSHRIRIKTGIEIVMTLFDQLKGVAGNKGKIEKEIKGEVNPSKRAAMMKAVSLPVHASTVANLANSLKTLTQLERQAFNLTDDDKSDLKETLSLADAVRLRHEKNSGK